MPPIFQHALNAALKFIEKRIGSAADKITAAVGSLEKLFARGVSEQSRTLDQIGRRFEKAVGKIADTNFEVTVDLEPLRQDLVVIARDLKKISAKKDIDPDRIEALLKMVLSAIKENAPEKLGEKIDAMDVVFRGLKPKDTVRFDDTQMKGLMAALTNVGQSSGIGTYPGLKSASNWTVARVALTSANTEYTYTFPANTVSWTMKLRAQGATLYYSSATGKFPTSGDNTTYMTMLPLGAKSQDGVEWGGLTMYLQSDTASQVVEIEVFTM
jgi:hypothetical protein